MFFPLITLLAISSFAWHLSPRIGVALQVTMSVLLIACPCALGLATPLTVWTALSTAIKHQDLFRSGEAVERLAEAKAVCFDKTGTLTTGTPPVSQTVFFGEGNRNAALNIAASLAASSSHPFSKAVAAYVAKSTAETPKNNSVTVGHSTIPWLALRTVSGGGVEATGWDRRLVRLGSVEFSRYNAHQQPKSQQNQVPDLCVACRAGVSLDIRVQLDSLRMAADQQAASIILLSVDRHPAIGFLIAESICPEAQTALQQLSKSETSLRVLSGDRPAKSRFVSAQLQVRGLNIECRLNPEQKVQKVISVRQQFGTTVMVGDTNITHRLWRRVILVSPWAVERTCREIQLRYVCLATI